MGVFSTIGRLVSMRVAPAFIAYPFFGSLIVGSVLVAPVTASAQDEASIPSHCLAVAQDMERNFFGASVMFASLVQPTVQSVKINFVGHSTFRIESQAGVIVATDFAGNAGYGKPLPTVVTMNHAHSSHFTDNPDPQIPHVLRGWNPQGGPAKHHLEVKDMIIRNVPTDIRRWGHTEPDGNSIFVFEVAGLCIGHLGHLHHQPNDEDYALIGRLDIVMVPVDGSMTMNADSMAAVADRLRSSILLPMHYWQPESLNIFLSELESDFQIDVRRDPGLEVSLRTLPDKPTVIVLPPG